MGTGVPVARHCHAATEALLVGATLARFALDLEAKAVEETEITAALLKARGALIGASQTVLEKLFRGPSDTKCPYSRWVCPLPWAPESDSQMKDWSQHGPARGRALCN